MNCPVGQLCEIELGFGGEQSPGPVNDQERLARAAIDPIHFNPKSGRIKITFIRQSEVQSGSLSVWRLGHLPAQQGDDLKAFFDAQKRIPDHEIDSVYAPPAAQFRSLALPPAGRGFSVLDDTKTGPNAGDLHPAHAAVTLCRGKRDHGQDEVKLTFAREALKTLFLGYKI